MVGRPVTVLLCEADVRRERESLLQSINSLMCTGEVPGLFTKDDVIVMTSELAFTAGKQVQC